MTIRLVSLPRATVLSVGIILSASMAAAQTPASTPPVVATQAVLPGPPPFARSIDGKVVWITTSDGIRLKGRVGAMTPAGLTLVPGGASNAWSSHGPRTMSFDDIVKVEHVSHEQRNGVLRGVLIGGGVGASVGLFLQILACEDTCLFGDDAGPGIVVFTAMGTGIGAAIGALVNRGDRPGDVIYAKPRTTTVAFAPILTRSRKGMAFTMTWR